MRQGIERLIKGQVADADAERWEIVEEWILTSFCLVAPTTLAEQVLGQTATD